MEIKSTVVVEVTIDLDKFERDENVTLEDLQADPNKVIAEVISNRLVIDNPDEDYGDTYQFISIGDEPASKYLIEGVAG